MYRGFPQGVAHDPYLIPELPISEESPGPPKFLCASRHAYRTLRWTPADPSEPHPCRFCCVGFWCVKTIAICISFVTRLYQVSGSAVSLTVYVFPCVRFNYIVRVMPSFIAATLGMSGWLDLAQQGLSPCKKHQASLGALTPELSRRAHHASSLQVSRMRAALFAVGSNEMFGGAPDVTRRFR